MEIVLVYNVHIQRGGDNTTPLPHNRPYISSCSRNFSSTFGTPTSVVINIIHCTCDHHMLPFTSIMPLHQLILCRYMQLNSQYKLNN